MKRGSLRFRFTETIGTSTSSMHTKSAVCTPRSNNLPPAPENGSQPDLRENLKMSFTPRPGYARPKNPPPVPRVGPRPQGVAACTPRLPPNTAFSPSNEVLPRQCPCLKAFNLWSVCGIRRTRQRSDDTGRHRFTQVRPRCWVTTYVLLV
jgi:hypothetical protein